MSTQSERNVICYGIKGVVPDGPQALAKSDGKTFFVKRFNRGPEAGHLVNPWSMWFTQEIAESSMPTHGKMTVEYKKVNFECFNLYKRFLETRNGGHLRNAERVLE